MEEADGRRQTFLVPFAAVPNLLRPGFTKFNVSAGQYRDQLVQDEPWVVQATIQRGLSNMLTGYTGVLASEGYSSGLLGLAVNTPIGAVSADVTMARTDPLSNSHTGSSVARELQQAHSRNRHQCPAGCLSIFDRWILQSA